MKNIKIIVSDLDGTLLDENKVLPKINYEAICSARKQGIKFGIASGRPVEGLLSLLHDWNLQDQMDFLIGMNGAQVYDFETAQIKTYHTISANMIHEIVDLYEEFDCNPTIYVGKNLVSQKRTARLLEIEKLHSLKVEYADLREYVKEIQPKLLMYVNPAIMEEIEVYTKSLNRTDFRAFKSGKDMFEFVDPLCSKAVGIQKVCEKFNTTMDHVLAFGDTTNDLEMLTECKFSVCMSNGTDDAKSVAKFMGKTNSEGGLGLFITENILVK